MYKLHQADSSAILCQIRMTGMLTRVTAKGAAIYSTWYMLFSFLLKHIAFPYLSHLVSLLDLLYPSNLPALGYSTSLKTVTAILRWLCQST